MIRIQFVDYVTQEELGTRVGNGVPRQGEHIHLSVRVAGDIADRFVNRQLVAHRITWLYTHTQEDDVRVECTEEMTFRIEADEKEFERVKREDLKEDARRIEEEQLRERLARKQHPSLTDSERNRGLAGKQGE